MFCAVHIKCISNYQLLFLVSEVSQLNVQVLITAICYKQDDFPESIDSLLVCVVQIKFGLSAQLGDRFA